MDPIIRHRLVLLACIIACCAVLSPFAEDFLPTDRSSGLAFVFAHDGPVKAFLTFAILLVPLTLIALIASVSGSALSGAFVLGTALCIFAGGFGATNGLLIRANLPHDFSLLAIETAVLALLALAVGAFLTLATPPLKARLPWLVRFPDEAPPAEAATLTSTFTSIAVTAPIACLIAYGLAAGDSPKQAIGALIFAFALGSALACHFIGRSAVLGAFIAPFILALLVYLFPLLTPMGSHSFALLWFTNQISGLCRILPIFYFAAGSVGAVLGVIIAGTPGSVEPAQAVAKPT